MLPRIAYLITTLFISVALVSPVLFAQCQPTIDCNQNGVSDQCDLDLGTSDDCNGNQIPDECDIELLTSEDCNLDGIPDECNPETNDLIGIGLAFGQGFGSAIDSSSQFTIVGAPFDDLMGTNTGSANIFRRIGTQWIEEMKIFGIAAGIEDRFGTSVAVADDLVVVGAPGKFFGRGAVYIYRRVGNNWWNYDGTVTAFDAQAGWAFGTSVDIQNEKLIVGATMTGTGTGPGAVYIFSQINGMWLLEHKLQSAAEEAGDHLGASVKLHGSRIAAGAPGRDAGGATNSGAVIIFEEAAGLWLETGTYQSISPQAFGEYGTALDMDQEHLLVGAPGEDVGDGAAYLYDRLSSMWINAQRLSPNSADEIGLFGSAVSLDVRTAAIGIPLAGTDQGNVCLLRQENGTWNPVENLISISDQLSGDKFGTSISCQIPFLLVGCAGEDSGESIWISAFTDCNLNLEDDVCDVTQGLEPDCNLNQIPDSCEIEDGTKQDCDGDGVPDECQISEGTLLDCNLNGVPDDCDISSGFSLDCNIDDLPDECQVDADPFHPVISNMPDPISVEADQDQCGAVVTWDSPEATDDCGMESLVSTHQPGSFFTPGLTIVTYTATDVSGNTSVSMFTVLVSDEQAPGLEGLTAVVTVQAPIDSCEAQASWDSPTPIDNCGIFSITSSHAPGSTFNVGLTTVTYTVMDLSGNVAELPFIVEVLDNHLPEIVGIPENVATVADPGMCSAVVEWTEPTPEDDCEIVSFLSTHQSGGVFPVGSTAVAYTVIDSSGLETTEEFTITVEDNQAPEFTSIPSSSTLGNDPDNCQAVVTWAEAAATDNCDIESITSTHQPGSSFSLGTTVVTVTAVDVNGNTTEHSFEITVNDTQLPILVGVPGDMTVENDSAQCFAVVNWALPGISDNCSVASFSGTHDSGFEFPLGSTTVTYNLVDTFGNTTEESFVVTVNDTEMPILVNMPVPIAVPNDLGQCGANVDWDGPIPWDNCNLVDFDASHQSGSFFPIGVTTVNFLVMDGNGQVTTSSFEILVDDEEAPKLNGMPADRTISTDAGLCSGIHDWTPPVPSDNCEVISFTASHDPGDIFSAGTTEVSYIVEDSAGIVTTDQFLITVIDTENPEIIGIPDDFTLLADQDGCSTIVDWTAPDSQDNCGISTFDITHASGSSFDVGTTTIVISTEDLHGNQTSTSFTVEILDDQLPVLSGIPAPITAIADAGQCGTMISWDEPGATDNCQIVGLGSDHTSGDFFDVGTTVVTYSVSDPSGNVTAESFTISIADEEHPEFGQFEELILATTDPGICQSIVTWDQPLVTDNCAVSETTSSHQPGDVFPVGDTVVDLLTTDVNGNETSASFTVSVFDLELPQIVGLPQEITAPTGEGVCDGGIVTWDEPTYTDNCSATGLGSSAPSGTFFAFGTTIVTYSVVDESGNENTATISVTVMDSEAPVFTSLPGTLTGSNTQGLCSAAISWDPPTATDNCSVDTITLSHDSGQDFPVGDTVVTAVATDVHGNVTTEVFTVSVLDEEAPQFASVPQNLVVENEIGQCGAAVNWIEPTGSDNCQAFTIEADHVNGAFFEVGTTPVIFSISDTAGNVVTESFEITVVDQELPAITAMPSDLTVTTGPGVCVAGIDWDSAEASDNCQILSFSSNFQSGDLFPVGTTSIVYTAQDLSDNIHTDSFQITVIDEELPEIHDLPANILVSTDSGACTAVVDWVQETSTDNCEVFEHISSHQPQDTFELGITTVDVSVTDVNGNSTSASFTVTVNDEESPQLAGMPADATLDNEAGLCGAILNWGEPTSIDNCQASVPTSDIASGSMFSIGTTVVTYSTEDPSGNISTEIFTVTVDDVDAPVIDSMPVDIEVVAPEGSCDAVVSWLEPSATDCISHEISSDEVNGGAYPIGDTLVTYTAIDLSGNTSSSIFTVTVLDQEQPEIAEMPATVQVDTTAGSCLGVATWTEPTASDCSGISSLVPDQPSGTEFPVGSTEVTYTAIDGSGNTSSASFTVTVVDSESPVVIDLPADIGLGAEAGLCGAVATWEEPTSSDNCEDLGLGSNIPSGSFFEVGTTAVTYSVSDASGNLTEESFLVTVEDLEGPEIDGELVDVIIGTQSGVCGSTHEWDVPDFLDNCGVTELVASHQPGDFFPAGETTVTYLVMDAAGHTAEASFLVEVSDLEIPQILTMPEDVVLANDPGVCGAGHTWDLPETSDNCVVSALVSSHQPGDIFPTGETTVFYTAQDTTGNIVSDQFTVIVNDLEAPIFNGLPAEITVSCDPGVCTAQVNWAEPVASDNCEILNYTISHQPGDIFALGTSTVSLEASDIHGNQSSATFTVVVLDQEAPEISGTPEDITLSAVEGFCGAVAEWSEPVATDNCQQLGLSSSSASGSFFPVGSTSVIYSVSDPSANVTESSFTVTVTDDEAPTFTSLPDDFTVPTEPGICGAVVTWAEPGGGDNCAVGSLTLDMENGTYLDEGEYLVTAVVNDIHGNSLTDQFTITVADMENPQLTGVFEDITLIADTGNCGTVATWEAPTTSDNCLGEVLAVNYAPGTYFVTGTTEVRYVATDASGNVHEEAFNVIVIDDQFPTIEGVPADIQVSNDPGLCTSVVDWIQETSSDNCSIGLHATTHQPGDAFELGTTVVGISVVDPSGNETSASFIVTVTDDENPQLLDMPADITIGTDIGSCGATVSWTEPTPSDNCEAIGMSSDIENGSFFEVGPTTVTYSLQDTSGNFFTDSFVVFVTEDEAPTITGVPADVVINVESGLCGASFDWVLPTISDNCIVAQESGSHLPGDFFSVGSTTVTYAAIDTAGNETSESFVVSVEDDEFPVITGVPLDVTLSSDAGVCAAVHEWSTPEVSDNCEIDSFLQTNAPGDLFLIGVTTVQFTAEDLAGNITEQQFTITVVDDEAPEILGVSSDIQIDTDSGVCTAVVDWVSETSSDNCGVFEHSTSQQPGNVFELGTTIVEINVTDVNGNVSTSSFAVTVTDNEVPLILDSPADISTGTDEGVCGATIDWNEPTADDNCQAVGLASDIQSGSLFEVGSTVVTYTVGDPSGNSAMVSFVVTITDGEAPTILDVPADVSIPTQEDVCGSVFDWTPPTITDNCQIATEESTQQPGDLFSVGITTVTYTATDDAGNSTSASFTVEVLDEEAPVIQGMPLDAVISVDLGICAAGHEWVEPSATDNCAVVSLGSDIPTGHLFELGSTVVTYTVEDSAGILTTSQFTVTVVDDEAPVISNVPDRVLANTAINECTEIAEWAAPIAEDNCELVSFTSSHTSGETFPAGDTSVLLVATDASGNVSEIEFLVTVTDIQIPSIIGLPSDYTVVTEPGICGAVVAWDLPFAVDNCGVETLTSDIPSGSFMSPGITTVTYTAMDVNENILITSFDVTVVDLEFPEFITAPADVQLLSEPGLCDVVVEWAEASATDNCEIELIESTHLSGDRFSLGITEVIISATDINGNVSIHSFAITVTDEELPLFTTVPLDITVENDLSVCGALVSWEEPVALDNCTIESLISDHMSGDLFEVGDTSVTYVILDSSGNTADTTFVVTVLDTEAPQLQGLPELIEASTDVGECTATVSWDLPEITDNCLVVNTMSTHVPGDIFPIGDTVVTYSGSDSADLVTTIAFLVTVSDQEQPQINSMPSNMTVSNDPGICGADVSWISPTAVDNCGVSNLTSDIENSSLFALGTTTVTYTATDIHGNSIDASFDVTVEDQELPILNGLPVSIQIGTDTDLCGATAAWAAAEATDNCEVVDVTQTHISGDFFPVGETTVTYLVTDAAGNEASVSFAVQVTDVQGPVVTGLPDVIDAENTTGQCGSEITWEEPTIADACGEVTFNASHLSGEFFPVGDNEVAYTATDSAGNVTIATFIVSVRDTELPVITSVPENQVVVAPPGHCAAAVNWEQPTATDNCEITQLVTSFYSGMEYAVGTTTVIVVATDGGSNQVTASFQITVLDEEDPEIVGMPTDLTFTSEAGVCGASVSWIEPSGIDGCGLSSFESSHDPDSFFSVGTTVVTYVVTDTSGNSVSDNFTITILDVESPTITPPTPITVTAPEGDCSSYVEVPPLVTEDACGPVEVVNDFNGTENASGVFPRGNTLINWSATDASGNISFTAGIVTVLVDSPDCNSNNNPDSCDITTGSSLDCNSDGVPDECQPDCDGDGIPDECEISQGGALDCDEDGIPDECEISNGTEADCDSDGVIDLCEILSGTEVDCDQSGIPDSCELATGVAVDCNGNGQPDSCDIASGIDLDCDLNGVADSCQISSGASIDCDQDGVIDSCELNSGSEVDCNGNGVPDSCDLATGQDTDCNDNQVPDVCDLASGVSADCNGNGILDVCDLDAGIASDCDGNFVPDNCEIASGAAPDCNTNGIPDSCDLVTGISEDCDGSGVPDSCEVASGATPDCNGNGIPDSCDIDAGLADCDGNGIPDNCDIGNGQVADCNSNGIPDQCDLASGLEEDCNGTGVPDSCEVFTGTSSDCNMNGIPDSCDIASGVWADCDLDGDIDSCEIELGVEQDCNSTGIPDSCEIATGVSEDCNGNTIPDSCDLSDGTLNDCNGNSIPDACEISDGIAEDCNGNGIPDPCDIASGTDGDLDGDTIPDSCQVNFIRGDGNGDGIVNIADGVFLLVNLFAGGMNPNCNDAADANDDGSIDVSDVISILGFQFNGTSPPPAPFPACGVDPTDTDTLGCASYNACL